MGQGSLHNRVKQCRRTAVIPATLQERHQLQEKTLDFRVHLALTDSCPLKSKFKCHIALSNVKLINVPEETSKLEVMLRLLEFQI